MTPWVTDAAGTGDDDDYDTGPAAYMRGLRYAFRVNSDIRAYIAANCVPFVCKNAEDVLNNYTSHSGDMTELTNDLATLVAARVVAGT